MIVKNEAPIIRTSIASVRPLIHHWIIVDTGSTDGTQKVVRDALADLPGTLYARPWRDFAHNRSESLELAKPHGIYTLIIDADDTLVIPDDFAMPVLDADSYVFDIRHGAIVYKRPHLVRSSLPWRYESVLHEFLTCSETTTTSGRLPLTIVLGEGGARRREPDTYKRDAKVLERALAARPTPFLEARYTFYLAQSYRDSKQPDKAIDLYLRRAEQGFWNEEIYCALLDAGRLMLDRKDPLDKVLGTLERAIAVIPHRAEALHAASLACRIHGANRRGTDYGQRAAGLSLPDDGLFLAPWIYEYGALDEYAVNAYWAGDYHASLDAALKALQRGQVPENERDRFTANIRFAFDRLSPQARVEPLAAVERGAHAMAAPRRLDARSKRPSPKVLVAILAKQKEPVLSLYLQCIEALDYPKASIVLYVRTNNNTDQTKAILEAWLDRVGDQYAAVAYDGTDVDMPVQRFGVHEWNVERFRVLNHIRDVSLDKAQVYGCDYYFTVDCDNFVRPCTLANLVALDLPIVAPLLRHIAAEKLYSNYHAAIDPAGYYADSDLYAPVLYREVCGLIEMPVVHCTYLVRCDVIGELGYNDGSDDYDYVIFARRARAAGVVQYLDNRQLYGYLTLDDDSEAIGDQLGRARQMLADAGSSD